jgi:hypothetical protein
MLSDAPLQDGGGPGANSAPVDDDGGAEVGCINPHKQCIFLRIHFMAWLKKS